MGLFCTSDFTVDLYILASDAFDTEAAFERFSSLRAIEFSHAPGGRDSLGYVVDEQARHPVVNNFWC